MTRKKSPETSPAAKKPVSKLPVRTTAKPASKLVVKSAARPAEPKTSSASLKLRSRSESKPAASSPSGSRARLAAGSSSAEQPPSEGNWFGQTADALLRFERYTFDIAGILLLALALMTLLALIFPDLSGGLLAWWRDGLRRTLGWGSFWMALMLGMIGFWVLRYRQVQALPRGFWGRVVWLEVAAFTSLALLAVIGGDSFERAEAGLDGGGIGWGLAELLYLALNPIALGGSLWRGIILLILLFISLAAGLGIYLPLGAWAERVAYGGRRDMADSDPNPVVSEAPLPGGEAISQPAQRHKRNLLPPQFRKNFRMEDKSGEKNSGPPPERNQLLPPLELLVNEQNNRPDERNINMMAGMIEKTLAEFGIPARVIGFRVGPTVTQFAVEPGYVEKDKPLAEGDANRQKVRVAQISALGRDLALALAAERLRIEAPVPGRPYVGIEVPNSRATVVRLRPIMEAESFYKENSNLVMALGRDVSGQPVVADLGKMPHLLIAGTTGSGKSVCIAALTTCLVMNNTPEDLRLVMVDPKMVELVRFNGMPHLLGKVETNLERILAVLRWTVAEMDYRYKLLESSHSRNLETYNRKARRKHEPALPRIVLMIDELADLMMSAPDQTEHNLVRLAQMARATGIHLVVATQRPSTDVVTGLIKANFPARMSFAVASSIDSRVILDTSGAETLLGRGDMLFLPPDASGPMRVQGVMVSDQEVERVISFWQRSLPEYEQAESSPWEEMMAQEEVLADRDDLIEKAIEIVRREQRANASMLQRRLRVGYPRAARLMEELEDMGVIGISPNGGRDREVLLPPLDDLDEM